MPTGVRNAQFSTSTEEVYVHFESDCVITTVGNLKLNLAQQ